MKCLNKNIYLTIEKHPFEKFRLALMFITYPLTENQQFKEVIIIGGGLAGLAVSIHLSKFGYEVLLIEKQDYPRHKVCGEYVSNEVLPYLDFLGIDVFSEGAQRISKFELTTIDNKKISSELFLGGFGISRYNLDVLLAKKAVDNGVELLLDTVIKTEFVNEQFIISTKKGKQFNSKVAVGAFGKRSNLDMKLNRDFVKESSPYLAVKRHVKGNFPSDLVALHNFNGGYCGVSKVEKNHINLCYITDYKSFKQHENIEDFEKNVLFKNTTLKEIFESTESVFDQPLTISQISFDTKNAVENHIIMCGDSAGMIHPLCGNGMGMAIRSAQIASQLIIDYLQEKITNRRQLELKYQKQWNKAFKKRLQMGHLVAALFRSQFLSKQIMWLLQKFPAFLPKIIERTHGKTMTIK